MSSTFGMALGGLLAGEIFDWTGSYQVALLNGIGWNILNMILVGLLLIRPLRLKLQDMRLQQACHDSFTITRVPSCSVHCFTPEELYFTTKRSLLPALWRRKE